MTRRRKRPLMFVRDLVPGTTVDSYFLLRRISPGNGTGPRLRARIWDRTGEAALIAWDWDQDGVPQDGPYRVVGSVGTYAGSLQVCAERLGPCPSDIDLLDLFPAASRPICEMWTELERLCENCANSDLQALLRLCLQDAELCERWRRAPAAVRHHHAYTGGLLEHTLGVAGLALSLADHFPGVDKDLLLAGALLHDIGKTEAYCASGLPDMTDHGRLLGHIYPGARIVDSCISRLARFPAELRDRLLHLIGSHHGDRQFGVLEVPKTPEAILLHYADNVDAKMNAVFAACAQAQGQVWTAPVRSLDDERIFLGAHNGGPDPEMHEGILDLMADDLFAEGLFAEGDREE